MTNKMNWGHKITILYLGFVALILTLVFMASSQKVDLVSADYYDQEIKFQDKINATGNAQKLNAPINFEAKNKTLEIIYPKELLEKNIKGEVKLYRPSDASLDYKTSINMNTDGKQNIESPAFKRGLYKMQINWTMNNKNYYFEEPVFMN